MSMASDLVISDQAHNRKEQIKGLIASIQTSFLECGRLLCEAIDGGDPAILECHNETDYFEDLGLKRSTAFHLINIYRKFGVLLRSKSLPPPDVSRLIKILPLAKDLTDDQKEEWVHRAITLTSKDYAREVNIAKGKPDPCVCKHNLGVTRWGKCKLCGDWVVV